MPGHRPVVLLTCPHPQECPGNRKPQYCSLLLGTNTHHSEVDGPAAASCTIKHEARAIIPLHIIRGAALLVSDEVQIAAARPVIVADDKQDKVMAMQFEGWGTVVHQQILTWASVLTGPPAPACYCGGLFEVMAFHEGATAPESEWQAPASCFQ